jgi:hypothetical protein
MAVIVQWQNAGLWIRMSWVRPPLAAPVYEIRGSPMRPFLLVCIPPGLRICRGGALPIQQELPFRH